jgi:hypothetical protein
MLCCSEGGRPDVRRWCEIETCPVEARLETRKGRLSMFDVGLVGMIATLSLPLIVLVVSTPRIGFSIELAFSLFFRSRYGALLFSQPFRQRSVGVLLVGMLRSFLFLPPCPLLLFSSRDLLLRHTSCLTHFFPFQDQHGAFCNLRLRLCNWPSACACQSSRSWIVF